MKAVMSEFPSLPIDAVLRELCSVLEAGTNAVLQAPPGENGDGKTGTDLFVSGTTVHTECSHPNDLPQCPSCSALQGAAMSRYSRQMKKELGF